MVSQEVLALAVIEAEASVLAYASEFFWASSNARAFSNGVSIVSIQLLIICLSCFSAETGA